MIFHIIFTLNLLIILILMVIKQLLCEMIIIKIDERRFCIEFWQFYRYKDRKNGLYKLVLEMAAHEYYDDYDELNKDYAMNILDSYLQYRGDDGRPSDVEIEYDDEYDIVRIKANIHYLGNDHTTFRM